MLERDYRCIAPGCRNQSRGPRFSYLCLDHDGVAAPELEAWRRAAKDRRKAARARAAAQAEAQKAPVKTTKLPEVKKPAAKAPEVKKPAAKAPEVKKPAAKAPEVKKPAAKAPEVKALEVKKPVKKVKAA